MPRVNRVIELFEAGQPVYYAGVPLEERNYEGGRAAAGTWADYLNYDLEHSPFDLTALGEFMRGLVDGGPTRSGHRTPTVIVTPPVDACDGPNVRANAWQFRQILTTGVHGLLLCHAETAEAVRTFVEACRYPFASLGLGGSLSQGRRGNGGQEHAAQIWGLSVSDYLQRADPWPLNPSGELLLGVKFENPRAVANCEQTAAVPGLAFAEWGPGDNAMFMGYPEGHDPPYPADMWAVRNRVFEACRANHLYFLEVVTPEGVVDSIREGVMIGAGRQARTAAAVGRAHTGRQMPV